MSSGLPGKRTPEARVLEHIIDTQRQLGALKRVVQSCDPQRSPLSAWYAVQRATVELGAAVDALDGDQKKRLSRIFGEGS